MPYSLKTEQEEPIHEMLTNHNDPISASNAHNQTQNVNLWHIQRNI